MDLVPQELRSVTTCHVYCGEMPGNVSSHDGVDVAVCTTQGYLIEISKYKVTDSCNLKMKDVANISVFHEIVSGGYIRHYIVMTSSYSLLVIQKSCTLKVVFAYENVEKYRLYDFHKLGQCQLGIWHNGSSTPLVTDMMRHDCSNVSCAGTEGNGTNSVADFVIKQLQAMRVHLEELKGESCNLRVMLDRRLNKYQSSNNFLYGSLVSVKEREQLSTVIKERTAQEKKALTITGTWQKLYGNHWVLGVIFWNSSNRVLSDIQFVLRPGDAAEYSYRIFTSSPSTDVNCDDNTWGQMCVSADVRPNTEASAVVVLHVPDFADSSCRSVTCSLCCSQQQFDVPEFRLTAENVVRSSCRVFSDLSDPFLVRDLLSLLTTNEETRILVKMALPLHVSMDTILTNDLGFLQVLGLGRGYYLRDSGCLEGTLIHVTIISESPGEWKLAFLTRDVSGVYVVVNALYDVMPSGTLILPAQC